MEKINSQEDLDTLLALPYWEDAFVREWYLLSPSYINNHKIIASDSLPSMFVLICTSDLKYPCIEFLFEDIEQICVFFNCDFEPKANFRRNQILFSFSCNEQPDIVSKCLYYRILDETFLGWKSRYGNNFFDAGGYLNLESNK